MTDSVLTHITADDPIPASEPGRNRADDGFLTTSLNVAQTVEWLNNHNIPDDECWPWFKGYNKNLSPTVSLSTRQLSARRLIYGLVQGCWPTGPQPFSAVDWHDHYARGNRMVAPYLEAECGNRFCVNPHHAVDRSSIKLRNAPRRTRARKEHTYHRLAPEVGAIRTRHANGWSYAMLADEYMASRGIIVAIVRGEGAWADHDPDSLKASQGPSTYTRPNNLPPRP